MTNYKVELEDVQGFHNTINVNKVLEATEGLKYDHAKALDLVLKFIQAQDIWGGYSLYYQAKFATAFNKLYNEKFLTIKIKSNNIIIEKERTI